MTVNIQPELENKPQKNNCAQANQKIPLFTTASVSPSVSPSLPLPHAITCVCKGLKLKHSLSVYFLWVVGESSSLNLDILDFDQMLEKWHKDCVLI